MKASESLQNTQSTATEDALRRAVDTTPAFIHTARPDGYLDYFNRGWLDFLGKSLEEVCGWRWTESVHPEDVAALVQKWHAALASGEPFEIEARVRRADGSYRALLHRKLPLRDEHGNIVKWFGSSVDIEDRKRAEERFRRSTQELQRSEFYLGEGQRLAHMGSWAFNAAGFDYWSPELFRIYGLDPGGKAPTVDEYMALVHPEDREFVAQAIQKMLADHRSFDFTKRIVRPDGEIRHVRCVGTAATHGGTFEGFIGTGMDVTEQEELTKALRKSEEELRQVLDLAPQLIGVLGPRRERLYANRMALTYYGISLDEWRQRSFEPEVHPDDFDMVKAHVDRSLSNPAAFELEMRLRNGHGTYRWFLVRYNPLRDDEGQVVRWYLACTD